MNKTANRKHSLSIPTKPTSYQWATIKRMGIQELITLYNENPSVVTCPEFFLNVKQGTLQLILRDLFSNSSLKGVRQMAKKIKLIEMLKGGPSLINLMMKEPEMWSRVFGFLEKQPIDQVCLSIFGGIFIEYARMCPNKLLSIIKEPEVQHEFSKSTRKFQIFQILYTMVFCLNEKTSRQQSELIQGMIFSLINVIFENQQGISIYDPQYWGQELSKQQVIKKEPEKKQMTKQEPNKQQMTKQEPEKEQMTKQEPEKKQMIKQESAKKQQIIKSETKQKQAIKQEPNQQQIIQQESKKKQIKQESSKKQMIKEEQEQMIKQESGKKQIKQESGEKQMMKQQKLIQETEPSQKPMKGIPFINPQQIFSQTQINKFFTKMFDSYEIQLQVMEETICNVADMLKEVCKNVKEIYKGNLYTLVNIMVQQSYVSRLFIILNLIRKFIMKLCSKQTGKAKQLQAKDCYEQIQNGIYQLLYNIILVYHSFDNEEQKHPISMEDIKGTREEKKKEAKFGSLGKIQEKSPQKIKKTEKQCQYEEKIKHKLLQIINQINHGLINQWINSKPYQKQFQLRIPQASGMNLKRIKMSRLWIIKILLEIVEIFQNCGPQASKLIDLDSTANDILNYIKQCIEINKWNNIMQNQLIKLIQAFLDSHYDTFIGEIENEKGKFSETLLGIIITNFRNKNHYFLDTMTKCVQGDQHFLFKVGQYISGKMSQQGDIKRILAKHEKWKQFFHKDLKSYENILNQKNVFSEERYPELQMKKVKSINDSESIPIERPIQTIKQMIDDIEDNRKWRTSQTAIMFPPRRRKKSFTTTQVIKQIDSLRNFELSPKK